MSKFIIHACKDRLWYVQDYLYPSMLKQGINETEISIHVDNENKGNLLSCMDIFKSLKGLDEDTWHIQDDVIISGKFKQYTDNLKSFKGIICGFCSKYDEFPPGLSKPDKMWYSFPCIRIPDNIAYECSEWFYQEAVHNHDYGLYIRTKKYDDLFFKFFLTQFYYNYEIFKAMPNLVNHIDYLIGGSTVNKERGREPVLAKYWNEDGIIKELEEVLKNRYK